MARPLGNAYAYREPTVDDLREEFLARANAKNLAPRTIEWYERHTAAFRDWCTARGIVTAATLRSRDLDDYLVTLHASGAAPHTVHGAGQVVKSLARFGFRKGYFADEISRDFTLPKGAGGHHRDVQRRSAPSPLRRRRPAAVDRHPRPRDPDPSSGHARARLRTDGLDLRDVDLEERRIRVMGKGRRDRELPFGRVTARALRRYARTVADHDTGDPFFISRTGRRLTREGVASAMRAYSRRAGIVGVRSSPHTLRHTGAKRFILSGGDVFTLEKLLGHRSLAMVRRYVELAAADVRAQHERHSPADTLLRRPRPRTD